MLNDNIDVQELIKKFDLKSHPEGGYFRETYRSSGVILKIALSPEFNGNRNFSTGIYFLLPKGTKSSLHRIKSDEIWHFYLGGPLNLIILDPRETKTIILGQDLKIGQHVQYVVPAGVWFGAYPAEGSQYCFVGCTVSPGFDFQDFEMGKKRELLKEFPHSKALIEKLAVE